MWAAAPSAADGYRCKAEEGGGERLIYKKPEIDSVSLLSSAVTTLHLEVAEVVVFLQDAWVSMGGMKTSGQIHFSPLIKTDISELSIGDVWACKDSGFHSLSPSAPPPPATV